MRRLHLAHKIGVCIPGRLKRLTLDRGVVSFSFDDFARSSWEHGRTVMEHHGVLATWYVAGALTGQRENGRECHTEDDLREVHAAGHEIASHSFSHARSSDLSPAQFQREIQRNDAFLEELLPDAAISNFAYPFGRVSVSSKRTVLKRFSSARGTMAGLNGPWCDLAQLRANSIDTRTVANGETERLIDSAAARRVWLVLYAHDISPDPTRWGVRPGDFERIVRRAAAADCDILPVREALLRIPSATHAETARVAP